jgi:hypothetical protein
MSLLRREPRPVYRVYAEDEYDGDTDSFGGEAQAEPIGAGGRTEFFAERAETESDGALGAEPTGLERPPLGSVRTHRSALTAGSLELRRRPIAFLVVALLGLVAAVVVILVFSDASRRAPRLSSSAPAVSTVTAGHSRAAAARPMQTPAPSNPVRRPQRARRPSVTARARTSGSAPASAVVSVPAALGRPLPDPPPASVAAEFGFER